MQVVWYLLWSTSGFWYWWWGVSCSPFSVGTEGLYLFFCLGCFFSKTAYLFLCRPRPSNVHAGAGYGFSTLRHGFFFKFLSRFMNRLLPQVMVYLPFTVVCTLWFSLCGVRVSWGTRLHLPRFFFVHLPLWRRIPNRKLCLWRLTDGASRFQSLTALYLRWSSAISCTHWVSDLTFHY